MTLPPADPLLPPLFQGWFAHQGWRPHAHQLAMLAAALAGENPLLAAPSGGGKTIAGFLHPLIEHSARLPHGLQPPPIPPPNDLDLDTLRHQAPPLAPNWSSSRQ